VAVVLPNCAEFMAIYLAVTQVGMYLTPINNHLTGPEIAYIVGDSGAKVFVGSEKFAEACQVALQESGFPAEAAFSVGAVAGFRPLSELTAGQPDTLPEDRKAGNVMNYTSGTTGKPKGVRRGLPELSPDLVYTLMTGFLAMFDLTPEDDNVHICGSPLYHTAVLMFSGSALHMGHAVVLMEKWQPEEMLRLIEATWFPRSSTGCWGCPKRCARATTCRPSAPWSTPRHRVRWRPSGRCSTGGATPSTSTTPPPRVGAPWPSPPSGARTPAPWARPGPMPT
jgi:acyl-CoA synthetase (AMP-forming)/AMP-acid ligase II